jgi:catechol 2,3-dioxygenase-like lactoylglutathione lyase family enzyme
VQVNGLGYPAIIVRNVEETAEFYTRAFGMERLYTEPNRDDAESIQTMLHAGGDTYLLLIGPIDPNLKLADASLGVGSMQYLTLQVSGETMDRAFFEFSAAGTHASEEIRRGYERLVFLEDSNGVLILLTAWTTEPPDGVARPAVLKRASELREAQGAPFIEDLHIRQAIEGLSGS